MKRIVQILLICLLLIQQFQLPIFAEQSEASNALDTLPTFTMNQLKNKLRIAEAAHSDALITVIKNQMDLHNAITLRLRGLILSGKLGGTVGADGIVFIKGTYNFPDGKKKDMLTPTDDLSTESLQAIWNYNINK